MSERRSYEHIVSVSGGKDSTALYLLAMERGRPFRAVFADTGNEHEWTYDAVRDLPRRSGGPEIEWVKRDFTEDRFPAEPEAIFAKAQALGERLLTELHQWSFSIVATDQTVWFSRRPEDTTPP